ncbi:hypothetical protein SYJ56_21775 [Algoriphagus sp. D3-2-R+10]|uniref:hypothetical protein n=1 Tax=Algoriphagus aurantiacus TaxID=3103948 RepID=UPI002B37A9A9|nr:hypothetical protein [Algoriphagus sp. D3-2-R+10]MEB2777959.1 hypothetical protein [Algoriphagus sp. D3-2-R+10]
MILSINTWNWELILAIIGALAWIPWLVDRYTQPKIYGRLISNLINQGQIQNGDEFIHSTMHFLKLSITCINKNFNVKDISIRVKYQNNNEWYTGNINWAHTSIWAMPGTTGETKKLILPNEQFLGFTNWIEKDVSKFYYLTFFVEKEELQEYETIVLTFQNYILNSQEIRIVASEIDRHQILWDDSIWLNQGV